MDTYRFDHLDDANAQLLARRREALAEAQFKPELFWPFWRPCVLRVLLVTDGGLDFSDNDFGLAAFIRTLLDTPGSYVRFQITLAHISNVSPTQMLSSEPRIHRRITGFQFDNTDHFGVDMYDEVMLFGIAVGYGGRGTDSNGQPYPSDRLADPELRVLTTFMNAGGGLFATGDHGALGRALCQAVPRARNMRLWDSTSGDSSDEVSMAGPRRNDTNRIGSSSGSQFDDQSDDTPQIVQPRIYHRLSGFLRFSFPHPLLCGPKGVIRVMPDHPHEGECIVPPDTNQGLFFGVDLGPEYPSAVGGGSRPLPEIISTSTVLSGTTSSGKAPTSSQSFGGICAYDGHRAGIGRVITDATWHHFVNVNLVGVNSLPPSDPKHFGFLFSATGAAHLDQIKAYYRNIAVWLARPERIRCMQARLAWHLLWSERVMEAVLSTTNIRLGETHPRILWLIGRHARDVLGRYAGQCQSVRLVLDLVFHPVAPHLIPDIDPWQVDQKGEGERERVGWFDGAPLLDIALGAGLVALREAFPEPDEKLADGLETEKVAAVIAEGGRVGIERGLESMSAEVNAALRTFK